MKVKVFKRREWKRTTSLDGLDIGLTLRQREEHVAALTSNEESIRKTP